MKKLLFFLFIVLIIIVLFVIVYLPGYTHYQEVTGREAGLQQQISEFTQKNRELEEELHLLRNDIDYLEKVVRDTMGLVKPGEEVYKFVEEEPVDLEVEGFESDSLQ